MALTGRTPDEASPVPGCLILIAIIIGVVVGVHFHSKAQREKLAAEPTIPLVNCPRCRNQHWLMNCPRCGWHRHQPVQQFQPQQQQYAPPPPSQVVVHHVHTIERQIVLVRCKYCQTQTRIDAGTCSNCGASNFS